VTTLKLSSASSSSSSAVCSTEEQKLGTEMTMQTYNNVDS
jgi:hypothetical protein